METDPHLKENETIKGI